jgi:hypothetical protein
MFYWYKEGDAINTTGFYFYNLSDKHSAGFRIVYRGSKNIYMWHFRYSKYAKKFFNKYIKMNIAQMNEDYNSIVKSYHKSNSN